MELTDVETLPQGKSYFFKLMLPNSKAIHLLKSQLNRMQYLNICIEKLLRRNVRSHSISPSSYMPVWEMDNPTSREPAKAKSEDRATVSVVVTICF